MKFTPKKIRMSLGLIMMSCFVSFALQLHFFFIVANQLSDLYEIDYSLSFLIVYGMFTYMWLPCILLIIIVYLLLTKVFKYEK